MNLRLPRYGMKVAQSEAPPDSARSGVVFVPPQVFGRKWTDAPTSAPNAGANAGPPAE